MNVHIIGWLLLLIVIKNCPSATQVLFSTIDTHLTATEGSCAEIKCEVSSTIQVSESYHFWMKNPRYDDINKRFNATIIYSTNSLLRPVSPDYATRVKYIGDPSETWSKTPYSRKFCSILICDLNNTDSANYSFRFVEERENGKIWATKYVNLTVTENLCPITFENPPVVNESHPIKLTCSTSRSCPSHPRIENFAQLTPVSKDQKYSKDHPNEPLDDIWKTSTVSFTARPEDDGKEFSCQTEDNKDKYLIRSITLSVQYAPKNVSATVSHTDIKEGQSVTLTCSAKAHPNATFTWFRNNVQELGEMQWTIPSITESHNGEYHCNVQNVLGKERSNSVFINVTYAPQVQLKIISHYSVYRQGDKMVLKCDVKRSNPHPHTYSWFKDQKQILVHNDTYVKVLEPADGGRYRCNATNTVGTGSSEEHEIKVQYSPQSTRISISEKSEKVKIDRRLTFSCSTEANPAPHRYSWYRYNKTKEADSLQWRSNTTEVNKLILEQVRRADEACYTCNATNSIGTGSNSNALCIQVLYRPTNVVLSMDTVVTEGQRITITCTADSVPPSSLRLIRDLQSSERPPSLPTTPADKNILKHTFNVTSAHTGVYICSASNSEGTASSHKRKLMVKHRPKYVTVIAQPALTVDENTSLTLNCSVKSYPEVTSFTWTKTTDGKTETKKGTQILKIESVSPADRGLYSCTATNVIGTGGSQAKHVNVKYAPKHTKITTWAEQQHPDGTRSVTLGCSSDSFPLVEHYSWYRKKNTEEKAEEVSNSQNYTVKSDKPGSYYCIAKNEISERSSDPVDVFLEGGFMKVLKFSLPFLILLLVIFFLVFFCRHRRNKSIQRGTTNASPCVQGWWNWTTRRTRINQSVTAEPFRSRDDQPHRPNAQRQQPRPDSTPASNINSVYCTVNLPARTQGPPAQNPVRQQDGGTAEGSLNYASLHFGNNQKNKKAKAEENIVYAMVFKQNPPKKTGQERLEDYENITAVHTAKSPNPVSSDSDTSEEDLELNYSQVSFKAKSGHQWASSDSSTSDEEDIQYSDIKI
uniref:B-cell receptor CD22 n=1 Tax=Scatophagus argus TaxID=75038 RepID=UPI001ED82B02|nr:B-cell receptor CD22 [Scatophagus argus]XP_046255909.1 B-cell receptor CD22 [Scatophagus argus]